jgi:hypothetical protein
MTPCPACLIVKTGLANFLLRLDSNLNPPNLPVLTSYDLRHGILVLR